MPLAAESDLEAGPIKTDLRINNEIRASSVRLILQNGEMIGVVSFQDALARAVAAELDLVEVAPEADPPVCRIYDFKKVLYEQKKRLKESKKKAKAIELKEIKVRLSIDRHDLETKLKRAKEFIEKGDKVKFTLQLRGREVTKPELVDTRIALIIELMSDVAEVEQPPVKTGRFHTFIMTKGKAAAAPAKKP